MEFIKLNDKQRKIFFKKIKLEINSPWEKFYPEYKISRTMFFNYLSGKHKIPKDLFLEWNKFSKFNLENLELTEQRKFSENKLKSFKEDSILAEILGALNGDGHLAIHNYEVCIVVSSLERDYIIRLKSFFEEKFGIPFTILEKGTAIKLRGYSKSLSNLLVSKYGLPKGNKLGKLKIPKIIYKNKTFLNSYLRGLFDTDGSFYTRKNEPVLEISSADKRFLAEVRKALEKLGFKTAKGKNRCFIYQKESIYKFFKIVKPANSKHLKKYQNYLNS